MFEQTFKTSNFATHQFKQTKEIELKENSSWSFSISVLFLFLSMLFFLQNWFKPFYKISPMFKNYYSAIFISMFVESAILIILSLYFKFQKKILPAPMQILFVVAYFISLSLLIQGDLRTSSDLSALALGFLLFPFIYQEQPLFYPFIMIPIASLNALLLLAWNPNPNFSIFLPIFIFAFLGSFLGFILAKKRQENNILWLKLKDANRQLQELSFIDPLTSLFNRRFLMENLSKLFSQGFRYNIPLSLIMIDLDHFKKINDTFGHLIGDQFLKELGLLLKNSMRQSDFAARFGGEEFILVLPFTSLNGAMILSERIRKQVQTLSLPQLPKSITISIGIAMLREGDTPQKLINRADQALYTAKANGRNQVVSEKELSQE